MPPPLRLRTRLAVLRRGPLLAPVLTLVGGTAIAQAVVFAARPLLTRLYTPEAFGALTLVTTVAALLSALASGGYRFAILLPERDSEAGALLGVSVIGALGTSIAALVALSFGGVWWLLPPLLFALDVSQTAEMWLTRRARFGPVSTARAAQSAVVVAVQVGVGLVSASAVGLVGGAALGFVVSLAVVGTAVWRHDGRVLTEAFRPSRMRVLVRRYRRFPVFSAPAAFLNLAATRLPVLILAAFASEAVVGQFGLAYGTLALPLGLVTGAAGQVFFSRAAIAVRDGSLPSLTRRTLRGLTSVTLFPSLAVIAAGPSLFAFVFGAEWAEAGEYARLVAPWTLAASIASPMTCLFDVLERQRADLGFSVFMAAVQTTVLVVAGITGTPFQIVLAASIAGTLLRLAHVGWMLRLSSVPALDVLRDTARSFVIAGTLASLVFAVDTLVGGAWTVAAVTVGGLVTLATAARRATP